MATRKPPRLNEPPTKARKINHKQNAIVAADEEPAPSIFNLVDDCCYAILDWLSLGDLRSFGQTCKWAQQIAVNFYKNNHSGMEYGMNASDNSSYDAFHLENNQKLCISGNQLDSYHQVKLHCKQTIEKICLMHTTLSVAKINCLKQIMRTVKYVKLDNCTINGDFYVKFLKFCPRLKVLCIYDQLRCSIRNPNENRILIGANNDWLTRKYPTLRYFELINRNEINELKAFFIQNPNVQSFGINSIAFLDNGDFFKTTNIKLNNLMIHFDGRTATVREIHSNLNSLYERGGFKSLHWYAVKSCDVIFSDLLENLSVHYWDTMDDSFISPRLVNIIELRILSAVIGSNMETTALNLVNLERLYITRPDAKTILSFIRYSAKLKKIKVGRGFQMAFGSENGLDLVAWNKERAKLAGAQKVTIYLDESVYLATKWATDKTESNLIELKREHSYEWDNSFE